MKKLCYYMPMALDAETKSSDITEEGAEPLRLSFLKRIKETGKTAWEEVISRDKRLGKAALFSLIAAMGVYEWGPFNEMVIGYAGVAAQEAWAADPGSLKELLVDSLAVGGVSGYMMGAQQAVAGVLMAGGAQYFPNTFEFWNITRQHQVSESKKQHGSIVTGLGLGTSAVIIEQHFRDHERTFKKDVKTSLGIAAIIGTIDFVLLSAVSASVQFMDKAGYDTAAHITLEVAKNPLTYIGAFAAIKSGQYIKERIQRKKALVSNTKELS